jgi:phosphoribosylaminoimidazolecarboxamide formyltransferase / IMP cyclohydrolase
MRRALISVSDKTGIVSLAKELIELGIELMYRPEERISYFADAGISVLPIEEVTHFPEMLDGRVKTLHPHDPWRSFVSAEMINIMWKR